MKTAKIDFINGCLSQHLPRSQQYKKINKVLLETVFFYGSPVTLYPPVNIKFVSKTIGVFGYSILHYR